MRSNPTFLYFELCLMLMLLVLGITICFKAKDNRLQRYWGILVILLATLLLEGNIRWQLSPDLTSLSNLLLRPRCMIEWLIIAQPIALLPQIALRTDPDNLFKLPFRSRTLLITAILCLSLFWNSNPMVSLHSLDDVLNNIWNPQVQKRIVIFILTSTYPFYTFIKSYIKLRQQQNTRSTNVIYYYTTYCIIAFIFYVCYTWMPSPLLGILFSIWLTLFPILLSYFFLLSENPFSSPPVIRRRRVKSDCYSADTNQEEGTTEYHHFRNQQQCSTDNEFLLYNRISCWMQSDRPFCNPDFSEETLMQQFDLTQNRIIWIIRRAGFTSIKEYIMMQRIEYFKQLAAENPNRSIVLLAEKAGFKSRATFYRNFEVFETITPKEMINKMKEEKRLKNLKQQARERRAADSLTRH